MTIAEKLDLAIKLNEIGTTDGGYDIKYGEKMLHKQTYMTNAEWELFLLAMSETAKKEYGAGGGDELNGKNGHPPKMASYGSSSRMIYNLSKEKKGFHFEKKLPTTVGGTANLDGFYDSLLKFIADIVKSGAVVPEVYKMFDVIDKIDEKEIECILNKIKD